MNFILNGLVLYIIYSSIIGHQQNPLMLVREWLLSQIEMWPLTCYEFSIRQEDRQLICDNLLLIEDE